MGTRMFVFLYMKMRTVSSNGSGKNSGARWNRYRVNGTARSAKFADVPENDQVALHRKYKFLH